jgi:hypothetical protein
MRRSLLTRIALVASMVVMASGVALAQSSTDKPTTDRTAPRMSTDTSMADKTAGRHVIEGKVTKVDAKKGWIDVKTDDGSMKLHFPPDALQTVKAGDSVSVELAMSVEASSKTK